MHMINSTLCFCVVQFSIDQIQLETEGMKQQKQVILVSLFNHRVLFFFMFLLFYFVVLFVIVFLRK